MGEEARTMTRPQFTAEASLYRTRGHYRTGVQVNKLPAKTIGPIYPSSEMEEEIHVHSCAPGWTDIGGTCWPNPLTEPSWGGSAGGGMPGSGGADRVVEHPAAALETTGRARVAAKPPTRNVWTPVKERRKTRSLPETA